MTDTHLGSCLCGAVRFSIEGAFDHFYLCHCTRCRKDSGSSHSANLFSSSAKLAWLSGSDKVSTYTLPETQHTKSFCSVCGSALPYSLGSLLVVPAGALTSDIDLPPDAHIHFASRAGWEQNLANVPSFERLPM